MESKNVQSDKLNHLGRTMGLSKLSPRVIKDSWGEEEQMTAGWPCRSVLQQGSSNFLWRSAFWLWGFRGAVRVGVVAADCPLLPANLRDGCQEDRSRAVTVCLTLEYCPKTTSKGRKPWSPEVSGSVLPVLWQSTFSELHRLGGELSLDPLLSETKGWTWLFPLHP